MFSINPPVAAADVRRRSALRNKSFRFLASAATVQGFKARNVYWKQLSPRERAGAMGSHESVGKARFNSEC